MVKLYFKNMNKKSLGVILGLSLLGVFGIFVYFNIQPLDNKETNLIESTPQINNTSMSSSDKYKQYSDTLLSDSANLKRVLFFYASWCPTCRPADINFVTNSEKIPEGVIVIRVNYNDPETDIKEKELTQKYGVTYQHTFVQIDKDGNSITRWNGGGVDELLKNLK